MVATLTPEEKVVSIWRDDPPANQAESTPALSAKATEVPELHPTATELVPPVPETLEEAGLSSSIIEQLVFKLLYFRGDVLGRDLSTAMGLKFSLIEDLIDYLKRQHLVQVKRSL